MKSLRYFGVGTQYCGCRSLVLWASLLGLPSVGVPYSSVILCFHFHSILKPSQCPSQFLSSFDIELCVFPEFTSLLLFLWLMLSHFNPLDSERMQDAFFCPPPQIGWDSLVVLTHNQFWRKFHHLLRRNVLINVWCRAFCTWLQGPFDSWH